LVIIYFEANILQENIIIPLDNYTDIDKELSKEIYNWIDYLCDFNNCEEIKKLFPEIYSTLETKDKKQWEKNRDENIARYKESIITYSESNPERVASNKKILENTLKEEYKWPSIWAIRNEIVNTILVKEYFQKANERESLYINTKKFTFPIDIDWYSQILETLDIKKIIQEMTDKYINIWEWILEREEFIYEIKWQNNEYKIIFERLDVPNPKYDWVQSWYYSADWYILMK